MELGKTCGQLWQISELIIAQVKGFQELEVGQAALQAAYFVLLQPGSNPCTTTAVASTCSRSCAVICRDDCRLYTSASKSQSYIQHTTANALHNMLIYALESIPRMQ